MDRQSIDLVGFPSRTRRGNDATYALIAKAARQPCNVDFRSAHGVGGISERDMKNLHFRRRGH